MGIPPEESEAGIFAGKPRLAQWAAVAAMAVALGVVLELAGLPAALLIGPMFAGMVAGVNGASVRVAQQPFLFSQGVVGCMIAMSLSPESLPAFERDWPLILGTIFATLVASSFLGWIISQLRILPGTVGVWGTAPGAASPMVLLAGAAGADQRLVAFMQYYRILIVTVVAAIMARIWIEHAGAREVLWFPEIQPFPFVATIAIAYGGAHLARLARIPSPFFVGPMIVTILFRLAGFGPLQIPDWLLAVSYATIGCQIGLRFTSETIRQVRRALPAVTLALLSLIAFCGGIAFLLAEFAGVDPLTAYLATSPGGMDAVAIIAATSPNVDISFVMALQMMRFIIVLTLGPALARLVAGWVRD